MNNKKIMNIIKFINSNKNINHDLYTFTLRERTLLIASKSNKDEIAQINLHVLEFMPKETFILLSKLPIRIIRDIFRQHTTSIEDYDYRYVKLRTTSTAGWLEYRKTFWSFFFNNDILEVDIL